MTIKSIITGMLLTAFTFTLQAQTTTPNVTKTQVKQQKRIKNGIKSEELTRKETKQLARQQAHINRTKKRAKADGVVTKKERATIRRKQVNANKNIAVKKNNRRDRN